MEITGGLDVTGHRTDDRYLCHYFKNGRAKSNSKSHGTTSECEIV